MPIDTAPLTPIHVIAEAGTNHNGKLDTALELVDAAVDAGADSVKFQVIYPEGLYLPQLWTDGRYVDNEVFQRRAAGMLSDADYRSLAARCKAKKTPFTASVFDLRGLDLLDELQAPYFKIASCDLNNARFIMQVAERRRPVVLSTGMASLDEIETAVRNVLSTGNPQLVLMHCVSIYPAPLERMNLGFLEVLKRTFGLPVGLSDHTESSVAAAAAVALGAQWIEKHFTLDRASPGFDHAYAMEPPGLARYISDIRQCAAACRLQSPKVQGAELEVKKRARRGIYAARDIRPGERLEEGSLLVVRPEGPLAPNDLAKILGKAPHRPIRRYEPLSLDLLE